MIDENKKSINQSINQFICQLIRKPLRLSEGSQHQKNFEHLLGTRLYATQNHGVPPKHHPKQHSKNSDNNWQELSSSWDGRQWPQ